MLSPFLYVFTLANAKRDDVSFHPVRSGVVAVYLRINGIYYAARCMRTAEGKVWRLRKSNGQAYDVCRGRDGLQCDCWDWVAVWANREGEGCKHCRALKAAGLFD